VKTPRPPRIELLGALFQVDTLTFQYVEIVLPRSAWRNLNVIPGLCVAKTSIVLSNIGVSDSETTKRKELFAKLEKLETALSIQPMEHPITTYLVSPWDTNVIYSGFCTSFRCFSLRISTPPFPCSLDLEFDLRALEIDPTLTSKGK
jgi:hypothetical protein